MAAGRPGRCWRCCSFTTASSASASSIICSAWGLALAAAAWWLGQRPGLLRFALGLLFAVLLLLCHFEAFAVFAVIAGSVEIEKAGANLGDTGPAGALKDLLLAALPFLVCLALFAALSPTAGVAGKGFGYAPGLLTKPLGGLYALSSGSLWLDAATVLGQIGLGGWLVMSGRLTVSRPLGFATAMMVLAFFVVPSDVMGALYADVRLGPALALLAVAALDVRGDARTQSVVAAVAVGFALLRAGVFVGEWRDYNAQIAPIAQAVGRIEPGSTLFAATTEQYPALIADTAARRALWQPPLKHVASLAVLETPVFVPMTWADPTQQPLAVRPAYRPVYDYQGNPKKVPHRRRAGCADRRHRCPAGALARPWSCLSAGGRLQGAGAGDLAAVRNPGRHRRALHIAAPALNLSPCNCPPCRRWF